ncbi:MAG: ABC transporter substrate-binding protein [Phycisphaeraceae bacterium JB051]
MMLRSLILLFCSLVLFTGCDRQSESPQPQAATPRYVTLAPAMSQILIDMGQQQNIVGIAQFDMTDAKDLPVVGNYLDIHTEKLLKLKPTHVMMMTGKNGTPDSLKQLAKQHDFELLSFAYPDTIHDVLQIVTQTSNGIGMKQFGMETVKRFESQMLDVKKLVDGQKSQRVLALIGTEPIMASGPNTVIHEMIQIVGSENVAADAPVSAPTYDHEKLVALNPDVILLLRPNAPSLANGLEDPRLESFRDLPINAVKNKRICLINDPLTFLPATTLPRIAKQFALAIYPQLSDTAADGK